MRARSGTMPSSSRSRIVRRYISVVSTRSVIVASQGGHRTRVQPTGDAVSRGRGPGRSRARYELRGMPRSRSPLTSCPSTDASAAAPPRCGPSSSPTCTAHAGAARHLAPPGAGEGSRRPRARRPRRAVPPARRLRGAARQRRLDRVLGCRRLLAHREAQRAPHLRRVRREVRRRPPRRRSSRPRTSSPRPADRAARSRCSPASTSTPGRTTRPRPA